MATYNEQLQDIWHSFESEMGHTPASPRDAVVWGVRKGLIQTRKADPLEKLTEDMVTALRQEYRTDRYGRKYRVNHAVRVTKSGVQYTLWAELDHAPLEHMMKAFGQRRKQIVGDCVQLKTDVDVYNDIHSDQKPIQMILDFTQDVEEITQLRDGRAA